jgi:signal transduction histidine kinase
MSKTIPGQRIEKPWATKRLVVAFCLLIGILVGVARLALNQMERINKSIDGLAEHEWAKVELARQALAGSAANSRIILQVFLMDNTNEIAPLLAVRAENTKKISKMLETIEGEVASPEEKRLLEAVMEARQPYVESYLESLKLQLRDRDYAEARMAMIVRTMPLLVKYQECWARFVDFQGEQMNAAVRAAEANYSATRKKMLSLSLLALLGAILITVFVTRAVAHETAERELAEQSLQKSRDELEVRVVQRTRELESAHKRLLQSSRMAGMAEIATSVLHNVGNVLNSVNVSCNIITGRLNKTKSYNIEKVAAVMEEHSADLGGFLTKDPQGRQLPNFLKQLGIKLAEEKTSLLDEVAALAKNVDHIKDIVAAQQGYARISGVTETIKFTDLIEDALKMNASALARHDVRIFREYDDDIPEVTVEKHKVLQVLVNLIRNAKQACDACELAEKRLTIRVTKGRERVRVALIDNGIGIATENLTRIFNHGFTTKKDGHGFGLHSGALAAREMGGSLSVHSEGTGKGATFTLEFPCQMPAVGPVMAAQTVPA